MSREYDVDEKIAYVEEYKNSGLSVAQFAREKRIPPSTLSSWLKLNQAMTFGEINLSQTTSITKTATIVPKKPTVFVSDDIKIELREGFNKDFLRRIVEVLIDDNWFTKEYR